MDESRIFPMRFSPVALFRLIDSENKFLRKNNFELIKLHVSTLKIIISNAGPDAILDPSQRLSENFQSHRPLSGAVECFHKTLFKEVSFLNALKILR
jgi:hypothetical protein